jgi:hypothetical protein
MGAGGPHLHTLPSVPDPVERAWHLAELAGPTDMLAPIAIRYGLDPETVVWTAKARENASTVLLTALTGEAPPENPDVGI